MIKTKTKIAFVGNFEYNCGSSNTLLGYVGAGEKLGYEVRASELGYVDKKVRDKVPVAKKQWKPDLMVIIYESYPFLSKKDIELIRNYIPREKRVLIDPDGKYLPPKSTKNDTNHPTKNSYTFWTKLYNSLSDVILQPILKKNINNENIHKFLYFGVDNTNLTTGDVKKEFDLIYVGNNWYRWRDIVSLIREISIIRDRAGRLGPFGMYGDGKPKKGSEKATYSDPKFLKKHNVETYKSVPYGHVERTMSKGTMNPIFVRPMLNKLNLVTPRMFETFMADTIPLLPDYFEHAPLLYGKEAEKLYLTDNPARVIANILDNHNKYKKVVSTVKNRLMKEHSYEVRLKELLDFA